MKKFPKILFVNGEPLSDVSATGITVSNLFKDWPAGSFAQIYTANLPTDAAKCVFSEKLTARDLLPFFVLTRRTITPARERPIAIAGNSSKLLSNNNVRAKLQYLCAPLLDLLAYRLPMSLIKQIDEFQPDVIYSLLGNIRITRLVHELGRRFQIPVVPHFMDDWLATYSVPGKSTGTWVHQKILNRTVRNLFDHVPLGMAIGEMMAREYSEKFDRDFFAFMNPVDSVLACKRAENHPSTPLVFVYIGGLHLRRDQALLDVIELLADINREGVVAELHMYTPNADEEKAVKLAAVSTSVRYCGSVSSNDVADTLRKCDIAIHVESTDPSISQYARYSVSTKIPQYFASGLPVLAYGPADSASSSYIKQSSAGVSIDGGDKVRLRSALNRLISDPQWRQELGRTGLHVATEHHLGQHVRSAFATVLSRAANSKERSYVRI